MRSYPQPGSPVPPDHQRFHVRRYPGAAGIGTTAGAVELVRHQSPMPGEHGIRLGHACDILQSLTAESFRDLGQGGPLCIRQPDPTRQVGPEDAVLGSEVFDGKSVEGFTVWAMDKVVDSMMLMMIQNDYALRTPTYPINALCPAQSNARDRFAAPEDVEVDCLFVTL
jgi:hypothetical protein